ncbi:MAG TPA: glycoside hydrolase family 36 protein, partial [Candidatus Methylacidiphilales bacterium]
YVVIDAGWSKKPEGYRDQGANGDWEIAPLSFPHGFAKLNAELRAQGQIPGIWFEFEVTTEGAHAHLLVEHQLKRHGRTLQIGPRHFWDFRDPWVIDYLSERVIEFLRREGFGYLKVDYNDTLGVGCDGPDGLGEGLRQHLCGVHRFFEKIREQLPELVIENCASGGHRLEPLMMGATSMSSFSDAHEGPEIPWISANLHRLVPPEKLQIWAVLRATDTRARLYYTLSAGFLGRLCLSGEVASLSTEQWNIAEEAMTLYRRIWPVIRHGWTRRFGMEKQNSQHLQGWQAVRRCSNDGQRTLVVWHTFADFRAGAFDLPLPAGPWKLEHQFNPGSSVKIGTSSLNVGGAAPLSGGVLILTRIDPSAGD